MDENLKIKNWQNFYFNMEHLVLWKQHHLERVLDERLLEQLGEKRFATMFRTLSVDPGRDAGKTYFILDKCQPGDLIITHTIREAENLKRTLIHEYGKREVSFLPIIDDRNHFSRGLKDEYNNVYVDEAHEVLYNIRKYELVYNLINSNYPSQLFFFLG